jgi:monovalent cation:proton antiporter-2 (CPA2) family protein
MEDAMGTTTRTMQDALQDLFDFMRGPKSDTLLLLLATSLITPVCKRLGTSPILGFLAAGMLLGPNGWGLINGIHTTETLAELGIVFFLFEMGIELSFERLLSMRKDVFGLGLSQFLLTAIAVATVGAFFGIPANALVVLGGGIALSSSAFVLQLLKDKNQLATRFGKASFGVLLFQDLAVVPLLVVTPILAGSGTGLAAALGSAVLKAVMALGAIAAAGRYALNPLFKLVAEARSQEAFLGVILLTVLSMSFMTEGLGLSNTLGAFLAGVLLSETKYRYQIEADIAPFRGVLLGLFFVTVGFEIDVHLIASKFPQVISLVFGILGVKAAVATGLSLAFGLSLSTSQQTGLILSQGGEFAFVAFGLARSLGILDNATTKLMLTSVSLTMALTPAMASLGGKIAKKLEEGSDFTHYLGEDSDAVEIKQSDDFVVVVGYGAVGKVVCDLLDRKLIKYVGLEIDPNKAIQARNKGLPVFYGDIGRPEVAEAFNVGSAKCVIVCIADKQQANRAVIALRRLYPDMKIFSRAKDADHAERLQKTLDVIAMIPILPEDNLLLTLPFGGAVLKSLGAPEEEVNAILEAKRKELLSGRGLRDSEEIASLMQLGVIVGSGDKDKKPAVTDSKAKGVGKEEDDDEDMTPSERAAAAAVDRVEAKSPMLASVIEAVSPGAADDDDDDDEKELPLQPVGNTTEVFVMDGEE